MPERWGVVKPEPVVVFPPSCLSGKEADVDYPIWDLALGGGVLIGIVAIAHVLVSHFAVGGGLAIALAETLAVRRGDRALRDLAKRSSWMLVLVSTVFGAISGVGIWVTIGLVAPAATSALIHTWVWAWATEWAFFVLEVAMALAMVATWEKVRPRTHLWLSWLYAFAAFMSLVIIQGILAFMLTPGRWIETRSFWDGFFNPSYLPGVVLRTGISLFLAGAYMTFAALREPDAAARARLVRWLAGLQVVGALVAYGGYRWWEVALPDQVRALFVGEKALLASLASTRSLALWALTAYLGLVLLAALVPRAQRWPVAAVALCASFVFFGGYERLREGSRKPFVIRDHMFSNGLMVTDIPTLNESGALARAGWAAVGQPDTLEGRGRAVFRAQCASCHTLDGYLGIRRLTTQADADMLNGILMTMKGMGEVYATAHARGERVDTTTVDYPLMPPLVGSDEEVEALATYLHSLKPAQPTEVADAR
jgi:mono/diheme cytochrome c family protein